jgi:hypothetical protein
MIVENATGNLEEVVDQRIAHHIADGRPLLARDDDVLRAQDGELLRDDGLFEVERLLQFLDAALAAHECLEDADAHRVGECPEEFGLECLKVL